MSIWLLIFIAALFARGIMNSIEESNHEATHRDEHLHHLIEQQNRILCLSAEERAADLKAENAANAAAARPTKMQIQANLLYKKHSHLSEKEVKKLFCKELGMSKTGAWIYYEYCRKAAQ